METPWDDEAACKGQDSDDWIGDRRGGRNTKAHKAVCATCPVTARCLGAALAHPKWSLGIWAGTSVAERAEMAREMRAVIAEGTDIRSAPLFTRYAGDPAIVRDVTIAVEAPVRLAAVLAARVDLAVVAAVALVARHDEPIAETIAGRADQPQWLCHAAARIAGPVHEEVRRVSTAARMKRVRRRRHGLAAA